MSDELVNSPGCRQRLELTKPQAGRPVICPLCQNQFTVPSPAAGMQPALAVVQAMYRNFNNAAASGWRPVRFQLTTMILVSGASVLTWGILLVTPAVGLVVAKSGQRTGRPVGMDVRVPHALSKPISGFHPPSRLTATTLQAPPIVSEPLPRRDTQPVVSPNNQTTPPEQLHPEELSSPTFVGTVPVSLMIHGDSAPGAGPQTSALRGLPNASNSWPMTYGTPMTKLGHNFPNHGVVISCCRLVPKCSLSRCRESPGYS